MMSSQPPSKPQITVICILMMMMIICIAIMIHSMIMMNMEDKAQRPLLYILRMLPPTSIMLDVE